MVKTNLIAKSEKKIFVLINKISNKMENKLLVLNDLLNFFSIFVLVKNAVFIAVETFRFWAI
jgi:hypothetical protein